MIAHCSALFSLCSSDGCRRRESEPVDCVDPLIDSANSRWIFFSSACRPFGMVNLSPDTDIKGWWNSGYCYHTGSICGFSHVHAWQLAGVSVMPTTGEVEAGRGHRRLPVAVRPRSEICQAGYHAVTLDRYGIRVELTSTDRVGFHRYTFAEVGAGADRVQPGVGDGALADGRRTGPPGRATRKLEGYVVNGPTGRRPKPCTIYFVARFDRPFEALRAAGSARSRCRRKRRRGRRQGLRGTGRASAGRGRSRPAEGRAFVRERRAGPAEPRSRTAPLGLRPGAGRVARGVERVAGAGSRSKAAREAQRTKFYTDLWHVLLGRRLTSDVDGKYCDHTGPEPVIRQIPLGARRQAASTTTTTPTPSGTPSGTSTRCGGWPIPD